MGARKLIALAGALVGLLIVPSSASAVEQTFTESVPIGTVGPYEVKQATKGPIPVPAAAEGGYITKMETDIVDPGGQPVPISRLMLHHIVFANIRRADLTCSSFLGFDSRPGGPFAPQRFYAAGEERAKVSMPPGYGYPIESGAETPLWGITYMVMNHRAVPDNARIQYTVTYEDDPVGTGMKAVKPYWLDVEDCKADPIYNVPGVAKAAKKAGKKDKGKKGKGKKSGDKGKKKKKKRKKKPAPPPTDVATRDYTFPEAGRIVAGAGHVHGGAYELNLTQPGCGNRQIAESTPTWGLPDHPFYTVRPILHEPGPINMSAFQTPTGLPVGAGSQIRLNSVYDNSRPHTRVMGIYIVYLAPDPGVQACDPLPGDVTTLATNQPGRRGGPIPYTIPLTGLDQAGNAITIDAPPGELQKAGSGSTVQVQDRLFDRPNLKIKQGSSLTYQFNGGELHNLTLANGPLGIGTDNLDGNRTFTQQFDRPGTYKFFCGLHPVQMTQRVIVDPKKKKKKKKRKKK